MKKLIGLIAAVLFVVLCVWMFISGPSHIEDTNGIDDLSLQSITHQQIIDRSYGSVGGPTISKSLLLGDTVEFSASKFTGVYEILYDNYILPSDFEVDLTGFIVTGGNFKMVVVHEDKIVAELSPDTFVDYRLENITGYISLRIVGESAAFSFSMTQHEYDLHAHD